MVGSLRLFVDNGVEYLVIDIPFAMCMIDINKVRGIFGNGFVGLDIRNDFVVIA